uniref:Putative ovule protein n=1 Tax=Solanum chacoense TaxID=4108 RepID=A0A0V0H0M4_SOLCH
MTGEVLGKKKLTLLKSHISLPCTILCRNVFNWVMSSDSLCCFKFKNLFHVCQMLIFTTKDILS